MSALAVALASPLACASPDPAPSSPSSVLATPQSTTSQSDTTSSVAPSSPSPRTKNWFDLEVGDCIVALPAVDLGEVAVTLVDCTQPHAAEVYLRVPLAVNTAIVDVANRECGAVLPPGPYSMTYLIDSNQDRTTNNPLPSTVLCLVQGADGQPLTSSAHM